jgi:serine/threonine protein kinase
MNNLTTKAFNEKKYDFIQLLREKDSVRVSLQKHIKKDKFFVVKEIDASEFHSLSNEINPVFQEINIGKKIDHENFAKTHKFHTNGNGKYYLIIEHIEGETLSNFLIKNKDSKIEIYDFKKIITQIFQSVIYCLNNDICPGDINEDNILVGKDHKVTFIDFEDYREEPNCPNWAYQNLGEEINTQIRYLIDFTLNNNNNNEAETWLKNLTFYKNENNWNKDSFISNYQDILSDQFIQDS